MSLPLRCLRQHLTRSGLPKWQAGRAAAQWGRGFAEAAADDDEEDVVLKAFRDQQKSYRMVIEGLKDISVPLDGNSAGMRKYKEEVEALKQKAGLPGVDEVVDATLEYKMACSQGDIRAFLTDASQGVDLGQYAGVLDSIMAAVDEAEASSGEPLTIENEAGWEAFTSRVKAIQSEAGLTDAAEVKDQYLMDMYTRQITEARTAAEDGMDALKRKEGLEGLEVSASDLKW